MLKLHKCYFILLLLVSYLVLYGSPLLACEPIAKDEKPELKKQKVGNCFSQELNLQKELDSMDNDIKMESYNDAAYKALAIAEFLNDLSHDKIKYAISNFPIISSNFFYKLANEYFIEYFKRDLQSVSFTEFRKWPCMMKANAGIQDTAKRMIQREIDEVNRAVTSFVKGINTLEESLMIVLEQTKKKIDIAKPF